MKRHLVVIGSVIILVTVGFSGCQQTQETQNDKTNQDTHNNDNQSSNNITIERNKFVGTWKNTSNKMTINLFSNGTCLLFTSYGTWDVKDDKLIMEFPNSKNLTYAYRFSNNDRTLYLHFSTDDLETAYTKQ
jgi:hypothetical protein